MFERADSDEDTRSISQLYEALTGYLDKRWGRGSQTWVYGEIQKLSDHRSGHCYVDLVDPAVSGRDCPTLKAKCWRSTWGPLKLSVARAGLALEEGSIVRVKGYVDLYAPRGELGFIITALDLEALRLAVLGDHARRREELLRVLTAEGLLETNRGISVPSVPLHVGLVASRATEGCNDFLGMLEGSGFNFRVSLEHAAVQGPTAPGEVAAALRSLATSGCDVVCVVRGGGSQADLAAFDAEAVARAIATCPLPVFTGIGHTGDVSIADLVASQAFRTPTACAEALVGTVREWYAEHVADPARRIDDAAVAALDESADRVAQARRHLVVVSRHRLARVDDALASASSRIVGRTPRVLADCARRATTGAARLGPLSRLALSVASADLGARRTLLDAYDPRRLLERGWSITSDEHGRLLRSVTSTPAGSVLHTRLADGTVRSTVSDATPEPAERTDRAR